MSKRGLYANMNARKKAGTSRSKKNSTITPKAYKHMKAGFPKKNSLKIANLADGTPDASIMNYPTEKGFFLDGQGKAYMQTGGKFYDAGEYDIDIHGLPVPLAQQMQINPNVANITPKDFSPPPFRYFPHIRIPAIKDAEMKHMKNFIEAMGGDTKGLVKKNKSMKVYG